MFESDEDRRNNLYEWEFELEIELGTCKERLQTVEYGLWSDGDAIRLDVARVMAFEMKQYCDFYNLDFPLEPWLDVTYIINGLPELSQFIEFCTREKRHASEVSLRESLGHDPIPDLVPLNERQQNFVDDPWGTLYHAMSNVNKFYMEREPFALDDGR